MKHVAVSSPAGVAAILGAVIGVALVGAGVWSGARVPPAPLALSVALGLAGLAEILIAWFGFCRERLAWSFALSLNGTAFVVFVFAIPKLGDEIGSRALAALIPLAFGAVTLLWALSHHEIAQDR